MCDVQGVVDFVCHSVTDMRHRNLECAELIIVAVTIIVMTFVSSMTSRQAYLVSQGIVDCEDVVA